MQFKKKKFKKNDARLSAKSCGAWAALIRGDATRLNPDSAIGGFTVNLGILTRSR
jgi:hypothetical protein